MLRACRMLRVLSLFLVVVTFFLILVGGIVHNTDSSLACPDWPLCYGSLMPEMTGNVAVEHSHRLLATLVGLLTIGLAIGLARGRSVSPSEKLMGIFAVILVAFQGLLGGLTVIYQLPTLVSTAHLATSLLFFSLLIVLSYRLFHPEVAPSSFLKRWTFPSVVTLLLYIQIVLGAFLRHAGAGLLCPDIPFCNGDPWPDKGWGPRVHMIHRYGGLLVSALLMILATRFLKKGGALPLSFTLMVLVAIQMLLGILSVVTLLEITFVTAHLAVATLLLANMILLALTDSIHDPQKSIL